MLILDKGVQKMAVTPNFSMPLLVTAQAQKEVTHNEALILIDALLRGTIVDGPVDMVPANPMVGECWIVGDNPSGDWADAARHLAICTEGGWRFVTPAIKMKICRLLDGALLCFDGHQWRLPPAIPDASGGDTVDVEARAVLAGVIQLLRGHGLANAAL